MNGIDVRAWLRAVGAGVVVGGLVAASLIFVLPAGSVEAADTSSSSVTVTAKDQDEDAAKAPFPDLEVTVSQTKDLVDQGIAITWTGGKRSEFPDSQSGGKNFLQIMQCWGDDPAGGPDRTTCQYGATRAIGAKRDSPRSSGSIASEDASYSTPDNGPFDPPFTSIPFRSSNGKTLAAIVDGKVVRPAVDVNTNEFFTSLTTNEVAWAGSAANGAGRVTFEVQTALLAPGLGCGAPVGTGADAKGRSCWLVIVPRGAADPGEENIINSGLFWDAWKHRLAIRLEFRPLGARCQIGAAERAVSGSEIARTAVSSWQPELCADGSGSVFSLITGTESDAVKRANDAASDVEPLALTSRSLGDAEADGLTYAPVALGGIAIAFAIDRDPLPNAPADALAKARQSFQTIRITPRLLAKLLTNSYTDSLPQGADKSHLNYKTQANPGNPWNITRDPEFLEINDPEWKEQGLVSPAISDVLVPQGRSDAAWAVWQYILADADARSFLNGTPDQWGMVVNPWYSTKAELNPTGSALDMPRDSFPKADPAEQSADATQPAINVVTWRPYTNDMAQGAYLTLRGDGQLLGIWDTQAIPPKFTRQARNLVGSQKVIGLTDTADASRYQLTVAELRNPAGQFVAPTTEGLLAAAAAMTRDPQQAQVLTFDPASQQAKSATTAYPLTEPVYAATRHDGADAATRASYAAFIRYAAGDGQAPGDAEGMLPRGYAPLPDSWRAAASTAADGIQNGTPPTAPATPAPPASGSSSAGGAPASSSSSGGYAPAPVADTAPADAQPAASGAAAGSLTGQPTAADKDLGAYPLVIPASGVAGATALGISLFASRRRPLG